MELPGLYLEPPGLSDPPMVVLRGWLSNSAPPPLIRAIEAYRRLDLSQTPGPRRPSVAPKRAKWLSDAEVQRARVAYEAGATSAELAVQFQVTAQTICRRLRGAGVRMRGSALTPEEVREAVELYGTGLSAARVAKHLGPIVSTDAVRLALIRAGVQMRNTQGHACTS